MREGSPSYPLVRKTDAPLGKNMNGLADVLADSRTKQVLIAVFLLALAVTSGLFWAVAHYRFDTDWFVYSMRIVGLAVTAFLVKDVERFLVALIILTLPMGIYFQLAARRSFGLFVYSWELASGGVIVLWFIRELVHTEKRTSKSPSLSTTGRRVTEGLGDEIRLFYS